MVVNKGAFSRRRKLNIWLVHQCAVPPSRAGITRHYSLARELIRRGHDVTIIATSFDHLTRQETRLAPGERYRRETIDGVPFVWLKTPSYAGNSAARLWNMAVFAYRVLATLAEETRERPDVVIGSSPPLLAALAAQQLAKRFDVPFVLEVRDLWPQTLIELGKMPPYHPVVTGFGLIERHLYRRASRIITALPGVADHMAGKGAALEAMAWVPNGIDMGYVPAPRQRPEDGAFTVMYAGTHGLANGLDTLLDAAALVQREAWGAGVRFRLIGDGPEKARLQQRAAAEGLTHVSFEDPVPKQRVYAVLQEADAFLMVLKNSPVFRYGVSPNKLYDYMASARPIIWGIDSTYNPVDSAEAGVSVPSEDPRAVAEAIRHLAALPAAARWEMGLRARQYVARRHDFRRLSERVEGLLLAAVQEHARGVIAVEPAAAGLRKGA